MPGRSEGWGVWGAISGPPISLHLAQRPVDELNAHRALAHGRRDALHAARPRISDREDARPEIAAASTISFFRCGRIRPSASRRTCTGFPLRPQHRQHERYADSDESGQRPTKQS